MTNEEIKKTRHKRCWFCGRRLMGSGTTVEIKGHTLDAHKSCKKTSEEQDGRENNAFGLEY